MPEQPLTIRAAPSGFALLAEQHGRAVAAIALTSGRITADASPGPAASLLRRLFPSA